MPIRTPSFWYDTKKSLWQQCLLAPVSTLYQLGHRINLARQTARHVDCFVICVGNAVAGGSGKTPVCIALNTLVQTYNLAHRPCFLTRGYGGSTGGAYEVSTESMDAKSIGDEPYLLATHSNTIISADRVEGAEMAQRNGADLIIMDDGYQNFTLHKDLNILVIDGGMGFGNGKTIPAGPLREPANMAFARADAVILLGADLHNIRKKIPPHLPVFTGHIKPLIAAEPQTSYIGFSGLGWPDKFRKTLAENGFPLVGFKAFADHHYYSIEEIEGLLSLAHRKNARLITTQKDYCKIPSHLQKDIDCLPISLIWDDENSLVTFLQHQLSENSGRRKTL